MKLNKLGEIALIERIAKRTKCDKSVVKGIGDDTAVIKWTAGKYLLFTCDMTSEGTHFMFEKAAPYQIGWKALARNISDIAAMGGVPKYAVVSAALRPGLSVAFVDSLYKGMADLAKRFKVNIVGGDTTRSDKIVIDVSLIGEVEKKNLVLRSGAKAGDLIFVTGAIGGSIKGRHLNFIPRVDEARDLVKNFKINSMIDISDSLVLDLQRVLKASSAGARICESLIPLSKDASSLKKAVVEGEDFELLFTMNTNEAKRFMEMRLAKMKTPVTLIGEVTGKGEGFKLIREDGTEEKLGKKGYLHF